jgi:hypothetical protein
VVGSWVGDDKTDLNGIVAGYETGLPDFNAIEII